MWYYNNFGYEYFPDKNGYDSGYRDGYSTGYAEGSKAVRYNPCVIESSGSYNIISIYKSLPKTPDLCIIYMVWGDGQDPPQAAVQFATYSVDRGNFISQNNKVIPLKNIRAWCYVPR